MKRPEVTIENYRAVYDFYEQHETSPSLVKLGCWVMDHAFKPEVHFATGAAEEITQGYADGNRLILASNHVNEFDQYHWAALPRVHSPMAPLMDGTVIPSKPSLFKGGKQYPLRWAIDEMASVPAFRTKDHNHDGQAVSPETRQLQRDAKARLIKLVGHKLTQGYHLAIFPEGERNTVDPSRVQPLKSGLGEMYFAAPNEVGKMVIPMAMYYGERSGWRATRRPTIYIDRPLINSFQTPAELTERLQPQLQDCLDAAIDRHA